jgi:formate hydrogenlyase transcriptional activator
VTDKEVLVLAQPANEPISPRSVEPTFPRSLAGPIIGESPALCRVLANVQRVAATDCPVLIIGETGTGKELIAHAIHKASARRSQSMVEVNCAAIPGALLESELFGHEKGAFTGAIQQRIGRFELASQGSIFLDEIGEFPIQLQTKLLRVLQEGRFERLGSSRTLQTRARVISATNRDLLLLVDEGNLRADLYYRLNVFPISLPPLRERREDIPLLAEHFIRRFSRNMGKDIQGIHPESMALLVNHKWPGNIRELQNVMERSVILAGDGPLKIRAEDLLERSFEQHSKDDTLAEAQRKHILSVLQDTNWVIGGQAGAAARLGLLRQTLQHRMRKLGISRPPERCGSYARKTRHSKRTPFVVDSVKTNIPNAHIGDSKPLEQ